MLCGYKLSARLVWQWSGHRRTGSEEEDGPGRHGEARSEKTLRRCRSPGVKHTKPPATVTGGDSSSPNAPSGVGGSKSKQGPSWFRVRSTQSIVLVSYCALLTQLHTIAFSADKEHLVFALDAACQSVCACTKNSISCLHRPQI